MVNKKIILAVLTIGMLATVAGAGTWAFFQDQSTGNAKLTTGNPDLVAVFDNQVYQNFGDIYLPHIVPGDSGFMDLGEIQNAGSAGGDLYISVPVYSGVDENLHIYACNEAGESLETVDLVDGGEIQIGSMDASVEGVNDIFPVKIKFVYDDTGEPQTGNGVSYDFAVTLTLKTAGGDLGTIDVANNYYENN